MFDRFTERARRAMGLARQEASRFGHDHIGTEHLLLGLVAEREGVAAQVLRHLKVEAEDVRTRVIELLAGRPSAVRGSDLAKPGPEGDPPPRAPLFTERGARAMRAAVALACERGGAVTAAHPLHGVAVAATGPEARDALPRGMDARRCAALRDATHAAAFSTLRPDAPPTTEAWFAPSALAVLGVAFLLAGERGESAVDLPALFAALAADGASPASATLASGGVAAQEVRDWIARMERFPAA